MKTESKICDAELIVSLCGELNEDSADRLKSDLDELCRRESFRTLILDFANVSFMNSTGIGVILRLYRSLTAMRKRMCIANPNRQIDKVITLSGLYSVIDKVNREV